LTGLSTPLTAGRLWLCLFGYQRWRVQNLWYCTLWRVQFQRRETFVQQKENKNHEIPMHRFCSTSFVGDDRTLPGTKQVIYRSSTIMSTDAQRCVLRRSPQRSTALAPPDSQCRNKTAPTTRPETFTGQTLASCNGQHRPSRPKASAQHSTLPIDIRSGTCENLRTYTVQPGYSYSNSIRRSRQSLLCDNSHPDQFQIPFIILLKFAPAEGPPNRGGGI